MSASMRNRVMSQLRVCFSLQQTLLNGQRCIFTSLRCCSTEADSSERKIKPKQRQLEDFRKFSLHGATREPRKKKRVIVGPEKLKASARYRMMKPDQDWTAVWPTAHSVKWSTLPFPVRQGNVKGSFEGEEGLPPSRYGNLELMKIPNFLHLTPPHIAKHCKAIKEFCTPWPAELETDADCTENFPVEVISSDYCFSSPSVHDPRSRVVTIKFKLSDLTLDDHAREKFLHLVGSKYDPETDMVTLPTDRCPTKQQNYDYAMYLLTALYHESWTVEDWETEKTPEDNLVFDWDTSTSREVVVSLLQQCAKTDQTQTEDPAADPLPFVEDDMSEEKIVAQPEVVEYKKAVEDLMNKGESDDTLENYKRSVATLLNVRVS